MIKRGLIVLGVLILAIFIFKPFSTEDITGRQVSQSQPIIGGISCSPTERFPIEEIIIVSGLEGQIPDNKNRVKDKIFEYEEFSRLHMYAIIKGSDRKYYLGYEYEPADRYPTQANINGRIVTLHRWNSNIPLPEISWSTYSYMQLSPSIERLANPAYYRGWEGIIILSQCQFGDPTDLACNNYQPIYPGDPACAAYSIKNRYDPECKDYNVGTNRFKASIYKSPEETLQSALHRISRKGSTGNEILNTAKLFHGNVKSGVGSCPVNIENIEWVDCADLQQGIAFYMDFIDTAYDIGTQQLGGTQRLIIGGRTITEPRTDWGEFYNIKTTSGVNVLDVSYNNGVLYILDADSIGGVEYSAYQQVPTYSFINNILEPMRVRYVGPRRSSYGQLPGDNGFSSVLAASNYIFFVDPKQGYEPKNIDFLHIYEDTGFSDLGYRQSISMKGPFDSYKNDNEIGDLDSDPKDVALDGENIYVLIEDFSTIMRFDINGAPSNWRNKDTNAVFIGKLAAGIEIPEGQIGIHYESQQEVTKQPDTMIYFDGKLYVGFSKAWPSGLIRVFDSQTGEFINEIETDASLSLAVDKTAGKLYSLGRDKIAEFTSNGIIREYTADLGVSNKKFDVDNGIAFIVGDDGSLVVYDIRGGAVLSSLPKRQTSLNKYRYSGAPTESNVRIEIGDGSNQLHPGDFFVMGYPKMGHPKFSHTIGFYKDANNNGYLDESDIIFQSTAGGSLGGSGAVRYDYIRSSWYLMNEYFVIRKWNEAA